MPPACAGCGRYGAVLCRTCERSFRPPATGRDRFLAPDPGIILGDSLEVAVAAFAYGGSLRRALANLKYGSAATVAEPLARYAGPALDALVRISPEAKLVPVPVHIERVRQRGYNQAKLIADALAQRRGLSVDDVLTRRKPTLQQHRLDRAARLRNLRGAFELKPDREPPKAAILVDDILTTSATLEACAVVLRAAGAERVLGFAIAREV